MSDLTATDYFTPVLDADVPEVHRETVAKYRQLATEHAVPATHPVCYRVKAGFTPKGHAGPCNGGFKYLQYPSLPYEPTKDCLVFWVPRLLKDSMSKDKIQQEKLLSDLKAKLELPVHHLHGFGKVSLAASLIITHHKATGERLLVNQWAHTDDTGLPHERLDLGVFDDAGIYCIDLRIASSLDEDVGVFAIGIEPL